MRKQTVMLLLWSVAGASLVAGLLLTLGTPRRLRDQAATLALRQDDWQALQAVRHELRLYELARETVAAQPPPPPLMPLAVACFDGARPDDTRDLSEPLLDGWIAQRHEITYRSAALEGLDCLLRDAAALTQPERTLPAWRATRCMLRTPPGQPGHAHIVLLMEGLEKAEH